MSYFNQISPEAEELLREIIDLKENKSDTSQYWHSRFNSMGFDDEELFRSLFAVLKSKALISITWADGIPYRLSLTNNGRNYFKHKEIYLYELKKNRHSIGFEYLDNESEKLLKELLDEKDIVNKNIGGSVIARLIQQNFVKGISCRSFDDIEPEFIVMALTQKGKTYFEMKEKYEMQLIMSKSNITNITTGDNSPVNLAVDGSTASQTIDYANNEQLKALSNLADMINSAKEFTGEERAEILELIDGAKSATQTGKKVLLKTLITSLGTVLTKTPVFIVEKWDEIQAMFGG